MDKLNGIPPGGKILNFPKKKAEEPAPTVVGWNCSLDVLKDLVSDIENGKVSAPDMIYIAMRVPHPTEPEAYMFPRYIWGPPSPGASLLFSGLLHQHLKRL